MMRSIMLVALVSCVVSCGSSKEVMPPKRPNTELIVGEFERRPPAGTTAMRFRADGSITVAHDRSKLDSETLGTGTWKLEKDQLTLVYGGKGMCADGSPGVYQVVISKLGIHFKKVDDSCAARAKIDGEVWKRAS